MITSLHTIGVVALLALFSGSTLSFAQPFVVVKQDTSTGTWWFQHNGEQFLSFAINHANNGGLDDGVGGRERAVCIARTNNSLCGDSLNFGEAFGYAPYYNATYDKYEGNETAWAEASITRISDVGFNAISGWSATVAEQSAARHGLYYFHLLDIGVTWPVAWSNGFDFDVWSTNYSQQCETIAAAEVAPRANDPYLIAWQTDNEPNIAILTLYLYLNTYASSGGGDAAITFLQSRYNNSLTALNSAWNISATAWNAVGSAMHSPGYNLAAEAVDDAAWLAVVTDQYFAVAVAAIRKYDTNHMISGIRFAFNTPAIVEVAGKYCDFIDQHDYNTLPDVEWLAQIHNITGKPVVIGEFSFTSVDGNVPNTHGARAYNPASSQTARAALYTAYESSLWMLPYVIGTGWWNFVDEPWSGRWPDGENSNYGLFTLADDMYSILGASMSSVHAAATTWHNVSGISPCVVAGHTQVVQKQKMMTKTGSLSSSSSSSPSSSSLVPLNLYYSASRQDHFLTITGGPGEDCFECMGLYSFVEVVGYVEAQCTASSSPSSVGLVTFYSDTASDNALLFHPPTLSGYDFARIECFALPPDTTIPNTIQLFSMLPSQGAGTQSGEIPKADYWAVAGAAGVAAAEAQGYVLDGDGRPFAAIYLSPGK